MRKAVFVVGAPRLPSYIVGRPRLLALLDSQAPIVVVRAGVGTGKSVLLSQWARHQPDPVLWIGCATRVKGEEFWTALLAEARQALRVPSQSQAEDSGAAESGPASDEAELAAHLRALPGSIRIVVDDADRLPPQVLEQLVAIAAGNERVVLRLSARSATVLEALGARLRHGIEVVTDLTFTEDETRQCLEHADGQVSAEVVQRVHDLSGGLALAVGAITIGLDRSLLAAETQVNASPVLALGIGRLLGDLLAPSIRASAGTTDAVEAFRRCAAAEVMSVDLAARLTGRLDIRTGLEAAVRDGLGEWVERSGPEPLFRFIPAVRHVLLRDLAVSPIDRRALCQLVVDWALEADDVLLALRLAALERDPDLAELVVVSAGRSVVVEHADALRELLLALPGSRLRGHPALVAVLAMAHVSTRDGYLRAIELLDLVSETAHPARPGPVRLLVHTARATAQRLTGSGDQGVAEARASSAALSQTSAPERRKLANAISELHNQNGLTLLYSGRIEESVLEFESAFTAARASDDRARSAAFVAAANAFTGDLPESRRWLDGLKDLPTRDREPQRWALLQVAEAIHALERQDLISAEQSLAPLDYLPPPAEHWAFFGGVHAWLDLCLGRPQEGLERLLDLRTRMVARTRASRFALHLSQLFVSVLHLAVGDVRAGALALDQTRDSDVYSQLTSSRVLLAGDEPERALSALLRASAVGLGSPRLRAEHAAVECAVLLRLDRQQDALRSLDRLWSPLRRYDLRMPLALLAERDLRAIDAFAREQGRWDVPAGAIGTTALLGAVDRVPQLTPRERSLLVELAHGGDAKLIASRLHVSVNTIKTQRRGLYRKLGVSNRTEALAAASSHGLLSDLARELTAQG